MAHLKIKPPYVKGDPTASFGTQVFLVTDQGEEILVPGVREVNLRFRIDEPISARIEVLQLELPEVIESELRRIETGDWINYAARRPPMFPSKYEVKYYDEELGFMVITTARWHCFHWSSKAPSNIRQWRKCIEERANGIRF